MICRPKKSLTKIALATAIVVLIPSAAWAWPNYASTWNGGGSEHWMAHNNTCEMYIAYGESGSPQLASVQTDLYSGSTACNTVKSYINGDLFGSDWSADSGWKYGGASWAGYWGECDWNRHYSNKNGVTWTRTKNC